MTFLLDSTIKTTLVLAATLLAVGLLRKQSAAIRHCILFAGILCAGIAPLVPLAVKPIVPLEIYQWETNTDVADVSSLPISSPDLPDSGDMFPERAALARPSVPEWFSGINLKRLFSWIWLTGIIIGLAVLLSGFGRLVRIAVRAERVTDGSWVLQTAIIARRYGLRRRMSLLRSKNPGMLANWGVLFPKVLLPAGSEAWPQDRIRAVLCHELAHIQRKDWWMQMTAEILRVIYWFNPLLWIACTKLRLESEHACDNAVLNEGFGPSDYASHLLDIVRSASRHDVAWSALMMARESTTQQRFKAILNPDLSRGPVTHLSMLAILIAATAVMLPVCSVGQAPPTQEIREGELYGTIRGQVTNGAGDKLPGASVTALVRSNSLPLPLPLVAETDANGAFVLPNVPAGTYLVKVCAPGFLPSRNLQVVLSRGQDRKLELKADLIRIGTAKAERCSDSATYTGQSVTMDLKNADIREFFSRLARVGKVDIGVDPSVNGTITAHLKSVPWDKAFDLVVRAFGLSSYSKANVLRVVRADLFGGTIPAGRILIEGRVSEFALRSPRTVVEVRAPDMDGKTRLWPLEWASTGGLILSGQDRFSLHGDRVVVVGDPIDSGSKIQLRSIQSINRRAGFTWGSPVSGPIADNAPSNAMMFVTARAR